MTKNNICQQRFPNMFTCENMNPYWVWKNGDTDKRKNNIFQNWYQVTSCRGAQSSLNLCSKFLLRCTILEKEVSVTSYNYNCAIRICNRLLFFKYCEMMKRRQSSNLSVKLWNMIHDFSNSQKIGYSYLHILATRYIYISQGVFTV